MNRSRDYKLESRIQGVVDIYLATKRQICGMVRYAKTLDKRNLDEMRMQEPDRGIKVKEMPPLFLSDVITNRFYQQLNLQRVCISGSALKWVQTVVAAIYRNTPCQGYSQSQDSIGEGPHHMVVP